MKKFLFLGIAVLAMAFVSCDNKAATTEETSDSTQVEAAAAEAPAAAEVPALADIVEKAKAEGANWTADQWKENITAALQAFKPFAVAMADMNKKASSGDVSTLEDAEKLEKDYPNYPQLINEIVELAGKSANGKEVVADDALQQLMDAQGIPSLK